MTEAIDDRPDDSDYAMLNVDLYLELTRVLHDCLMRGVEAQDVKLLAYQCGVDMRDVEGFIPATLRRSQTA